MIKFLNNRTIIIGTFLYLFFLPIISDYNYILYSLNYFSLFTFFAVLATVIKKESSFFKSSNLILITFSYSLLFSILYNLISYYYNDNLYVFSEADAITYHEESLRMKSISFFNSIDYYLRNHEYEDLGMVLILSNLYRLIESKLFYNFYNLIIGVLTAVYLFKICRNFMSEKNSFLCSLAYSLSSYVMWFHSSGLKESSMVMLIVAFFYQYYNFQYKKSIGPLLLGSMFLACLLLFRPAIVYIIISSIGIGLLISKKLSVNSIFLIIIILVSIVISTSYINAVANRFLSGSTADMLAAKESEGMIKGGIAFTYFINILASTCGPLTTILPTKPLLTFYSSGLIFKIMLSIFFWLGVYYSFKHSNKLIYPIIIFILLEMIALVYILESLELRKSLTHFPLIFVVAFWFIEFFEKNEYLRVKQKFQIKRIINIYILLFTFLIIYWNYR